MMARYKRSISQVDSHTYLLSASLLALSVSLSSAGLGLKDVPDLLPKHQPPPNPADMAKHTRIHTHTRKHVKAHLKNNPYLLMTFSSM